MQQMTFNDIDSESIQDNFTEREKYGEQANTNSYPITLRVPHRTSSFLEPYSDSRSLIKSPIAAARVKEAFEKANSCEDDNVPHSSTQNKLVARWVLLRTLNSLNTSLLPDGNPVDYESFGN